MGAMPADVRGAEFFARNTDAYRGGSALSFCGSGRGNDAPAERNREIAATERNWHSACFMISIQEDMNMTEEEFDEQSILQQERNFRCFGSPGSFHPRCLFIERDNDPDPVVVRGCT